MASSNTASPRKRIKLGRPAEARLSETERDRIKEEIRSAYNCSLPLFYEEAFTEAIKPQYKGFKQPGDQTTVKDAFVHFFSGSRSLPPLYWRVLTELIGIAPVPAQTFASENKQIRLNNPTHFTLTTKNKMPQWADSLELDLGGRQLKTLTCKIETRSPYFRFGIKLLEKNKRLFGVGSIQSQDANLLVHIGRNNWSRPNIGISATDIFRTWYLNGISLEPDKKLFSANRSFTASIELGIDSSFGVAFSVNGICCLKQIIPPEISRRVAVFAWGDREEYVVEVNELSVEVE